MVDPYYFGMVIGKDKKVKYLKNEQEEKDLAKPYPRVWKSGRRKNRHFGTQIVFSDDDVEKYNEMVILDEWFGERMLSGSYDMENTAQTPVTSVGYNQIKKITDARGTEYAVISLFEQRNRIRGHAIAVWCCFHRSFPY